jgi:hypothetical protein
MPNKDPASSWGARLSYDLTSVINADCFDKIVSGKCSKVTCYAILPNEATIDSAVEVNACRLRFVIDSCGCGWHPPNCSHLYDLGVLPDQIRNTARVNDPETGAHEI